MRTRRKEPLEVRERSLKRMLRRKRSPELVEIAAVNNRQIPERFTLV